LKKTVISVLIGLASMHLAAQDVVTVKVNNLKNNKGKVLFALFADAKAFPSDDKKAIKSAALTPANNAVEWVLTNLPKGKYAISLYHDENGNEELDTNWFGIPTEGYGFSNNVMGRMGPPSFEKAAFHSGNTNELEIKLNY